MSLLKKRIVHTPCSYAFAAVSSADVVAVTNTANVVAAAAIILHTHTYIGNTYHQPIPLYPC